MFARGVGLEAIRQRNLAKTARDFTIKKNQKGSKISRFNTRRTHSKSIVEKKKKTSLIHEPLHT